MLVTEGPVTAEFWENLVGEKVCQGFLLRQLIGSTGHSAVYRTSYGEVAADMKLVSAGRDTREVPALDHPNLMRVYASGKGQANGLPVRYIVTEAADETLAGVMETRLLTPAEVKEMLSGVLQALIYLHGHNRIHGRIKPSNIFAVGDTVKLSVDSIRPEGVGASADEDMRALGLTIIETLTHERQPSASAGLPQPMRDIVEHALENDPAQRWTAGQAALRLSGKIPRPINGAPSPAAATGGAATASTTTLPKPESAEQKREPAVVRPIRQAEPVKTPVPVWVYPAAGGGIALALILALFHGSGSSGHSPGRVPSPVIAAKSAVPTAPPVQRIQPKPTPFEPAPHAAAKSPAKPAANPPVNVSGKGWFVVVASYGREVDAAQMAQTLGRRFPSFKPSVFPPSAIDTHYLVIIGSGLTEDKAEALRQRALASGFPHDTYIKKYPTPRG